MSQKLVEGKYLEFILIDSEVMGLQEVIPV